MWSWQFANLKKEKPLCGLDVGVSVQLKEVKVSSYIAQYPILRIAQSALHFISLAVLFNQTPYQLLWEACSHMLQLMRESCSHTHQSLVYCQVFIYTAE